MCRSRVQQLVVACAVVALTVNFSASSHAQNDARRLLQRQELNQRTNLVKAGINGARLIEASADELELSEETLALVEASIEEMLIEEDQLRTKLLDRTDKVEAILSQGLPDGNELALAVTEMNQAMLEWRLASMRRVVANRALLTPDQLEKFMAIRAKQRATPPSPPKLPTSAAQDSSPEAQPDAAVAPSASEQSPEPHP